MHESLAAHYLGDMAARFVVLRELADKALAQLDDEQFFRAPGPGSNSAAVIVKHLAGNMRSRWTDFLTTDGEKPDRLRDTEFVTDGEDRRAILERWEAGWKTLFDTLESLRGVDPMRTVTIRREPHTVVEAVNRQLAHYGQHTGQIVFLAKHLKSSEWKTLSIPRGQSAAFNERMEREQS